MICYKDMTWCSQKCANENCFRNYTKKEQEINENGVDLPLSVGNMKTRDCGFKEPKL